MLPKIIVAIAFLCSTTLISASKVLAVIPTPSYSHQIALRKIWIELSLRGHQVTLITTDPINDPNLVNLTEIDVSGSYQFMDSFYKKVPGSSKLQMVSNFIKVFDETLDYQLSQESVRSLIRNESLFDVVISESLFPEYGALADLYDCPKILISSLELTSIIYNYIGLYPNHLMNPDMTLPFLVGKMSFLERIISFLFHPILSAFKWWSNYPKRHEILKRRIGEGVRTTQQIVQDTDLILTNTHPVLHGTRPISPNVVPIGGGIHILPPKELPKDLKDYLDSAKDGCIYFSLGTNSKPTYMKKEKIQIIVDTLSELPYKVLWKFEDEDVINPPKNVKFISWAPQQDILRHPNVILFIMQGGLQSLEESILSHVPMVMLPMMADQEANAKRMEDRGIARIVPHQPNPVKEDFNAIIMDVITNPKYKRNIIKMAQLLMDQPMGGVDRAVWWIEYVIRYKGAKHLRNPTIDLPTYQYHGLDVIAALTVFFYLLFKLFALVLRFSINLIRCKRTVISYKKKNH